jgi:hypothetical protein
LEHQFVTEIDGGCEILSVEPPWLLMTMPFNPKNTPPLGGFNCSRSIERARLALASAGAELRFANGWSLAAKFDGEFAGHAQTYAGTGTLRYGKGHSRS